MKVLLHLNKIMYTCSTLLLISFISSGCDKIGKGTIQTDITGTYTGIATIEEQILLDGEVIFDTSYSSLDQLIVNGVDIANKEYHFELKTTFKTYYDQAPLDPTNYILDENWTVWEGLDEFGYTYDNKKHWVFDPLQDTVYFRLARAPYGPTIIDNPDSVGHYFEELHTWNYVLRAQQ